MLVMLRGDELRDAGLTGSAQRLLHYEIAASGTASAFAGQLGCAKTSNCRTAVLKRRSSLMRR